MASPGVGEVWLYKDPKFQGFVWKFTASSQNFDDLGCKKKASSLRIGPGCSVILYKDIAYNGAHEEYNVDTSNLGSMSDASSSLQIMREGPPEPWTPGPGEVYLYRDQNFEGYVWRINKDIQDVDLLGAKGKISSVRVGAGVEALLFNETEWKGKVLTAGGNLMSLSDHNDKVASIKIMKK